MTQDNLTAKQFGLGCLQLYPSSTEQVMSLGYPTCDVNGEVYRFGRCFADQDWRLIYVPIEKNVTRVIQPMITTIGFKENEFLRSANTPGTCLIVLRDPVQRWVSGLVEYLLRVYLDRINTQNNMTRQNITTEKALEQIVFDLHTCPQHRFLEGFTGPKQYIWFDQDQKPELITSLAKYFNEQGFSNQWTPDKFLPADELVSQQKRELTQLYQDILKQPDMLQRIKNFYSKDYELIDSIKFYS
jgi:hypothetical protein